MGMGFLGFRGNFRVLMSGLLGGSEGAAKRRPSWMGEKEESQGSG